jgi:hypothetical protein
MTGARRCALLPALLLLLLLLLAGNADGVSKGKRSKKDKEKEKEKDASNLLLQLNAKNIKDFVSPALRHVLLLRLGLPPAAGCPQMPA